MTDAYRPYKRQDGERFDSWSPRGTRIIFALGATWRMTSAISPPPLTTGPPGLTSVLALALPPAPFMRKLMLAGFMASACGEGLESRVIPVAPGEAEVQMASRWIQGELMDFRLKWPNQEYCNMDEWFCRNPPPSTTMTVLSVDCHGCALLTDPTGTGSYRYGTVGTAVATTDGPISINATMRFDATGLVGQFSGSATGVHEVALEAECALIDASALSSGNAIPPALVHDCGATRTSSEVVVIAPAIRTSDDALRWPFCFGAAPCIGPSGEHFRPQSLLSITPAPMAWGISGAFPKSSFAAMPSDISVQTVSLSAPLASGEISMIEIAIPPVL